MKPIISFTFLIVFAITFASCMKNGNTGNTSSTVNIVDTVVPDEGCPECETLADRSRWRLHDSINHALVMAADPLWQYGRNNENMLDWSYQVKWYDECKKVLIHAYDSIHPGKNVKDKDMYMLEELIKFFDTYPDNSNVGKTGAYILKDIFVTYKVIHYSISIMETQKGCLFGQEMNAWNEFERLLVNVCEGKIYLDYWFGGTGASANCTYLVYKISSQRLEDVKRLNKYCHNDLPRSQILCTGISDYGFEKAIDSVMKTRDITVYMDRGLTGLQLAGYYRFYSETFACRDSLIEAYYNWLSIRECLFGFDNKSAKKDKMIAIVRELLLFEGVAKDY